MQEERGGGGEEAGERRSGTANECGGGGGGGGVCEICLSALTDSEESKFLEKLGRTSNMHINTVGCPAGPIKEIVQKNHQRAGLVPSDTVRYGTV